MAISDKILNHALILSERQRLHNYDVIWYVKYLLDDKIEFNSNYDFTLQQEET